MLFQILCRYSSFINGAFLVDIEITGNGGKINGQGWVHAKVLNLLIFCT